MPLYRPVESYQLETSYRFGTIVAHGSNIFSIGRQARRIGCRR
jgi:hypothetical protein